MSERPKKQIPSDFSWEWYLKLNRDLLVAGISDEGAAVTHWLRWGLKEGRPYKKPPGYVEQEHLHLEIILESKKIDYEGSVARGISDIRNSEEAEVNFIIPVRGRTNFLTKTIESAKAAAEKFSRKVNFTVSENSPRPEHRETAQNLNVDYIWTESHSPFNKCFAMNIGVFFTKKTPYLIFHDVDCLVQSDFFIKVFDNIAKKNCKAIQTFSERRVLYLNETVTAKVLRGEFPIDDLSIRTPGVSPPYRPDGSVASGAPGGSVCVARDLFFRIGGYDPYYFESYAPEDIFFWLKAEVFETFETCTEPRNEIYHMHHSRVEIDPHKLFLMESIKLKFEKMKNRDKWELLEKMNNKIKKYE
jgi:hypothetical protein